MKLFTFKITTLTQLTWLKHHYPDCAFMGWTELSSNQARGELYLHCTGAEAALMVIQLGVEVIHGLELSK